MQLASRPATELLSMIEKSEQGGKFKSLYYSGDLGPRKDHSAADLALCNILAFWCGCDAALMDGIFRGSALMRSKWDEIRGNDTYGNRTLRKAIQECRQVYTPLEADEEIWMDYLDAGTKKNPESAGRTPAAPASGQRSGSEIAKLRRLDDAVKAFLMNIKPQKPYGYSEKGNAAAFADCFKNQFRYNATAKEWYMFTGKNWSIDIEGLEASKAAKSLWDGLMRFGFGIEDDSQKKAWTSWYNKLGQMKNRIAMIKDARDVYYINADALDSKNNLYNCQNGTLNLSNMTFHLHNPDDLLSKVSNVCYNPNAGCPAFNKFMSEIMLGDESLIKFLQKSLGYALTADTRFENCLILYGPTTRNGKGTLMETILHMHGGASGYAMTMKPETLARKQNSDTRQANGDIARLNGARFLNVSEPPKNMIFDEALLKTLTGRDTITARHMYEREIEFLPQFKLFINTNYLPSITDETLFTSGRINVVPFKRHFAADEQDRQLKNRLKSKEEISGVFNWCLEGLQMVYKDKDLGPLPPAVIQATQEYFEDSDKIGNFIKECLISCPNENISASDAYAAFEKWCKTNDFGVEGKKSFTASLRTKNLLSLSGTVNGRTQSNVIKGYKI
jgi:putative DNA primase/helicase